MNYFLLIGFILLCLIVNELVNLSFHGTLSKKRIEKEKKRILSDRHRIADKGMIHWYHSDFYSKVSCFYGKWYVQGHGLVKRGSELSDMIDMEYKKLMAKDERENNSRALTAY